MNRATAAPVVLFRVAAGPRVGFGHLVRAISLAEALGVQARLSIRGGPEPHAAARRLGARTVRGNDARRVLAAQRPGLLVVDDPVGGRTAGWRRAAREAGIPIASVHDLGIGLGDADLVVDGSLRQFTRSDARSLLGPRYAILRPALVGYRKAGALRHKGGAAPRGTAVRREGGSRTVLIALGGGPRWAAAMRIARRVAERHPAVEVAVAGGFMAAASRGRTVGTIRQVRPGDFDLALARADVAVTGGGVTLFEACCLGVPSVALAVVRSQRPTVEDVAARGAALDGGLLASPGTRSVVAHAVSRLLAEPDLRRRIRKHGRALWDGRGAARVASVLRRLAARPGGRPR